jgi:uncharacterized protein YecE (DUF72 family)
VGQVRVGTSGWSYREWVGAFYPRGTSAARMLDFYARRLPTVEAHNTFRRRPRPDALARWRAEVPEGFRFAPKAHVAITHQQDLAGIEDRVTAFFEGLAPLGDRVGPVLFQLPHREPDVNRLDRLLSTLPEAPPAVFELGPAWHVPDVLDRLDRRGAALVAVDAEPERAGAVAYVRLRRDGYTDAELDEWAARLAAESDRGRDVYAFFKHDDAGAATRYATRVMEILRS